MVAPRLHSAPDDGHGDHFGCSSARISGTAVKVAIHRLRQRFRQQLRAELEATLDSTAMVDAEMAHLFAALSG
jgi:hypothetical protein